MAKPRNRTKLDTRGPLQRAMDNEEVSRSQSYLDVLTPEQAASGCYHAESRGRRYFRLRHLDRLHRNGKLSYEQHQAGTWYRNQYEMGRYDGTRTMDLDRTHSGNVVGFDCAERIQDARDRWREARLEIPRDVVGFIDKFLLHDSWPDPRHQRQRDSYLKTLRKGLDALIVYLRLPT